MLPATSSADSSSSGRLRAACTASSAHAQHRMAALLLLLLQCRLSAHRVRLLLLRLQGSMRGEREDARGRNQPARRG